MSRLRLSVGLLAGLLLLATPTRAIGAGSLTVTHERSSWHNQVTAFTEGPPLPCTDPVVFYTPTVTSSGHAYLTSNADGTFHFDLLDQGTFVTVPTNGDPNLPTYSGRYAIHLDENLTAGAHTTTFTFASRGTGTDGSSWVALLMFHVTVNPDGSTIVDFGKDLCPHGDPLG